MLQYMKLQQGLPFCSVILDLNQKEYLKTGGREGYVRGPSRINQGSIRGLLESVKSLLSWGSVRSLIVTKFFRGDLDSSPNLESWFGQLSNLRPGVISNKFILF